MIVIFAAVALLGAIILFFLLSGRGDDLVADSPISPGAHKGAILVVALILVIAGIGGMQSQ